MRTCGRKIYGVGGRAETNCGQTMPGSDWIYQCKECQRRDAVVQAVNGLRHDPEKTFLDELDEVLGAEPFRRMIDSGIIKDARVIDADLGLVEVTPIPAVTSLVISRPDPNEAEVDRILARWSGIAEHAISEWEHSHMSVTTADVRTMADYIKFNRAQTRASNSQERLEMSDTFMIGQIMRSLQQQGASYATAKTAAEDAVAHTRHYHGKDVFGQAWKKASEVAERLEPGLKITSPK